MNPVYKNKGIKFTYDLNRHSRYPISRRGILYEKRNGIIHNNVQFTNKIRYKKDTSSFIDKIDEHIEIEVGLVEVINVYTPLSTNNVNTDNRQTIISITSKEGITNRFTLIKHADCCGETFVYLQEGKETDFDCLVLLFYYSMWGGNLNNLSFVNNIYSPVNSVKHLFEKLKTDFYFDVNITEITKNYFTLYINQ